MEGWCQLGEFLRWSEGDTSESGRGTLLAILVGDEPGPPPFLEMRSGCTWGCERRGREREAEAVEHTGSSDAIVVSAR